MIPIDRPHDIQRLVVGRRDMRLVKRDTRLPFTVHPLSSPFRRRATCCLTMRILCAPSAAPAAALASLQRDVTQRHDHRRVWAVAARHREP
jgi:hypothetical protein